MNFVQRVALLTVISTSSALMCLNAQQIGATYQRPAAGNTTAGDHDLSGEWQASFTTGTELQIEKVRIRQVGNNIVATKITGDEYVPAGKVTIRGTYDSNPFSAEQVCADLGYKNPDWSKITITVLDANHFKAEGGCSGNVVWERTSLPSQADHPGAPPHAAGQDSCGAPLLLTPANYVPPKSGWPRALAPLHWRQDSVYLRSGGLATGTLTFLEAFATVKQGNSQKKFARTNVGIVLICGSPFPKQFASLPNDKDSIVLRSREVLTGPVEVDANGIHVKGRTFARKDVALIHLKGPPDTQYPNIIEPPDTDAATRKPPNPPSAGKTGREIPWGRALWRGIVRFDLSGAWAPGPVGRARGTYAITWKEDEGSTYFDGHRLHVRLSIVDLTYNGVVNACGSQDFPFNGSGFDYGGTADKYDRSYVDIRVDDEQHDAYPRIMITGPVVRGSIIHCRPGYEQPAGDLPGFMNEDIGGTNNFSGSHCFDNSLHVTPVTPPYTFLSGTSDCNWYDAEAQMMIKKHVEYYFVRGAPPMNVSPEKPNCDTAKGRRDLVAARIKKLLDDIKELRGKVAEAQAEQVRLNQARAALHNYVNTLLLAAAAQDVFKRTLEAIVSGGATEVAGALDESKEFAEILRAFGECMSSGMNGVQAVTTGDPKDYLTYILELSENAAFEGCMSRQKGDGSQGEETADSSMGELVSAGLQEFELGKVLADIIGQGNGEAEIEYVQEHLGELGPLVPADVLQKTDQYLKVTEQWEDSLKELSKLDARVAMDAFALADLGIALKDLQKGLDECNAAR